MIALFTVTIFLGATLLFVVQPLFGRLMLPLLGGAPAVWNTSMVFFQAALLAGYGYAHWLGTRVRPARQVWVHGALLLVAFVSLPITVPAGWEPPGDQNPIPWLLGAAVVAVGLPFFVVSATSPLLQRWLATTDHPHAKDPYFLYAASNAGSLLALLSYPVLIEPRLGLVQQSRWWAVGFGALLVTILACGWVASRRPGVAVAEATTTDAEPVAWRRRGRWVVLALVPSSLMLSVTNYISLDVAAIPLLWVVPLAIYLGTFTLAFARRQWLPASGSARLFRFVAVVMALTLALEGAEPLWLLIPLHLVGLFAAGLMCHQGLAADRPPARRLTEFYFWMALGGVLGGAFNALVAPLIFQSVLEYPLGLILAAWLGPQVVGTRNRWDWWLPVGLLVVGAAILLGVREWLAPASATVAARVVVSVAAVIAFGVALRRVRFALALAVVMVLGGLQARWQKPQLWTERSFFGIHRVDVSGNFHRILHGSTVHGAQHRAPEKRREPVFYYTRSGPLGQVMAARAATPAKVATVGLGSGGLLCYARAGDDWTYYEIDPAVERIARNPVLFTYIADSPAPVAVVLGDARLTLRQAADGEYDMLILDAYNSNAIPLHLITREALTLYRQKLRPGGLLVWHITNRHIELESVVAALAADAGWVCRMQDEAVLSRPEPETGKSPSKWAVMARSVEDLGSLATDPRWRAAQARSGDRLWTDDYSSLFDALRW